MRALIKRIPRSPASGSYLFSFVCHSRSLLNGNPEYYKELDPGLRSAGMTDSGHCGVYNPFAFFDTPQLCGGVVHADNEHSLISHTG